MTKAAELAKMGEVLTNSQLSGRRNMMYNGNFQCWQRSTSTTGLGTASGYFTADRWQTVIGATSAGRYTQNRTAGDPDGFNYGLVINCTTADTSIASGEALILRQKFEGQDLQHLYKGTSSAKKTVLCFYAKVVGSATDIVVEIRDRDNDRHICKLFTLTTSWAKYEFIIDGDTTGALDQDNACSIDVSWFLHAGSDYTSGTLQTTWASRTQANRAAGIDSIFSSTSNEFYIAGVQWEIGSQATPFEHRSFGEELELCSRYFQKISSNSNDAGHITNGLITGTRFYGVLNYNKQMRAAPTITATSGDFNVQSSAHSASGFSIDEIHEPSISNARLRTGTSGSFTNGQAAILRFGEAGSVSIDSEL